MKFICLGCLDKEAWGRLNADQQVALVLECTNFDQELAAQGHFAGGYALQDSSTATTVRWSGGKASRTDGPFAGRRNRRHAIRLPVAVQVQSSLQVGQFPFGRLLHHLRLHFDRLLELAGVGQRRG